MHTGICETELLTINHLWFRKWAVAERVTTPLSEPTMAQFPDAYIAKFGLDELRAGDRGDHPGDIYVSVIMSLLYSYLLYTVF